jgi:hypothetical protein
MESEFGKETDDGIILRSSTEFLTLSAVAGSSLPPEYCRDPKFRKQ